MTMTTPDLTSIAAAAVAGDTTLQDRVRGLVNSLLDEAEELIDSGPPSVKASLIRTVVPALVKEMNADGGSEAIDQMRASLSELHTEIRASLATPATPLPTAPSDALPADSPILAALVSATEPPPLPRPDTRNRAARSEERRVEKRAAKSTARRPAIKKAAAKPPAKKAAPKRKPT
jgi:hypothetical protein